MARLLTRASQMINSFSIQAKAPGKIILSGEHAAVVGCPALAMAINRYAIASITQALKNKTTLQFANFNQTVELLPEHQQLITPHSPTELALYTVAMALSKLSTSIDNVNILLKSNVPIGRGLGSSAAIIISLLVAINVYFKANWSTEEILTLALDAENKQHGKSSGLDIKTSLLGGYSFSTLPLQFIDTGQSQCSTGECVRYTQPQFKTHPKLVEEFSHTTLQLQQALAETDIKKIMPIIQKNHQLLITIGVIPKKVQHFIGEIEKLGMVGKICGAGSIRGDKAGIVLIVGEKDITQLINDYQYETLDLKEEKHGAHLL